jgi:hypothetical protein
MITPPSPQSLQGAGQTIVGPAASPRTFILGNIPSCGNARGQSSTPIDRQEVHRAFRSIVDEIPRSATRPQLEAIADELF